MSDPVVWTCDECHGTGLEVSPYRWAPCPRCSGRGFHFPPADTIGQKISEMFVFETRHCLSQARWWRKRQQALRNAKRPGLKPRRRKHWLRVAEKWQPRFVVHERRGITVGNPDAIARVQIED